MSNQLMFLVLGLVGNWELGTGKVESGKWKVESGKWKVKSIRLDNSSCE
jgi:hypothetical protein